MDELNEFRPTAKQSPHSWPQQGQWRRRGGTIVLDDPFTVDPPQAENGSGGGATPPRRTSPPAPSPKQLALLRSFFGAGEAGARARMANFGIPTGLTAATLRWYVGVARRVLADPAKATATAKLVQPLRLQLVARALAALAAP